MKNFLLLLFLFYAFPAVAQFKNPDSLKIKTYTLKVKTIPAESLKLPFESIKIIDARFDTSRLGYQVDKSQSFYYRRVRLSPYIGAGIENFYNQYYQHAFTANGKILLVSLKKLWINNYPLHPAKNSAGKDMARNSDEDIYAKFEFYIGSQNSYVPLLRMDTVFQLTPLTESNGYDRNEEGSLPFLCFALEQMIENAHFDLYLDESVKRKEMTLADVENYNAGMKNIPILKEPIKRGVFMTLDEFKRNMPSVTSFTARKLKKTKIDVLEDEKGNTIVNYFAFYDGTTLRINQPKAHLSKKTTRNYNILYRIGDSFQCYEQVFYQDNYSKTTQGGMMAPTTSGRVQPIPIPLVSSNAIDNIPRLLDLETGEIY